VGLVPLLGYACAIAPATGRTGEELRRQAQVITSECRSRGLPLGGVIRERATQSGKAFDRPGLSYALGRIVAGEARGLVVSDLSRLSSSAADLGTVLQWLTAAGARLIVVAETLDTATRQGRVAVGALIAVAEAERDRLTARTRNGLQAARQGAGIQGRPAVADDRELHARIVAMRARGLTMQAIADRLNEEGVPTVRGGREWRPSSVQRALGYRRRRPGMWPSGQPAPDHAEVSDEEREPR
jgi:DNA invertase Pin-like site-specific DNA recombinase